jgi:hypothetical protein
MHRLGARPNRRRVSRCRDGRARDLKVSAERWRHDRLDEAVDGGGGHHRGVLEQPHKALLLRCHGCELKLDVVLLCCRPIDQDLPPPTTFRCAVLPDNSVGLVNRVRRDN